MSSEHTSIGASLPLREVRVVNWPLRDEPLRTVAPGVLCGMVGVLAGLGSASWSMGLLAALALLVALWKLWIPVACDLGPAGITVTALRRRRHIAWRQIEHVECRPRGVLICTSAAAPWALGRGRVYLPWRHHGHLVAEFHRQFGGAARESVRVLDTALR